MTDATFAVELVDTHCHVDLFTNPAAVVRATSVRRIHTIAVTNAPSVFENTERLSRGSQYVYPALGLHPELVATHGHEVSRMWALLTRTRFVGEVGLDYVTADRDVRARQRAIFSEILSRCATYGDKTITVHSRRAASDTIAAIGARFPGRVILHWFSGSLRDLERAIEHGLYFSVNAAMAASQSGRRLIAAMPRDRVTTESDGPFVRAATGTADETSVPTVVRFLANQWRTSESDVARTVLRNSGIGEH